MTDTDVVREPSIIDLMKKGGISGHGLQVMADKGFDSVSPLLINVNLLYVAPPFKRQKESQFTDDWCHEEVENREHEGGLITSRLIS